MAEVFSRPNSPYGGARTSGAIDQGLRSFMLGTYNYMALGVAGTAAVVMLLMAYPQVMQTIAVGPMKWVLFAVVMGLGWFAPRLFFGGSTVMAHGAYWLYCAAWGALIAPMIHFYVASGLEGLIGQAFFIAAAMFGVTSLIGYTTKKDMTGWSGFLSMASIGLIVVMLGSYFFITDPGTSKTVSMGISAVVVLLFSVVTAFETQAIKSMYIENAQYGGEEQLKRSSIFGAFMLYGSFITLFIHILNLLGLANRN
ncbi:MAG: Bax inhibitor-1/YccA family protein [Hyphomicrobium sp.]|uniref:Bax inhibitor-1/YccA family protein n=1 Tax=Hyphomicrobium sp. TaxID=82 RepID=UPI0039E52B8E